MRKHQNVIVSACIGWLLSTLWTFGLAYIAIPARIPQNAVVALITSVCFLPITLLLAWMYFKHVLERLGKTTILWRLTVVPLIALLMTGVVLVAAIRSGNAPSGPFYPMGEPAVRLQVSTYSTNGRSSPAVRKGDNGHRLLVDFYRSYETEFFTLSPVYGTEAEFEAGVLLGTGPYKDLDLSGYDSLILAFEATSSGEQGPPPIGVIIKDAGFFEIKCPSLEPFGEWEGKRFRGTLPLSLFAELSLERIDVLGLFVQELKPRERLDLELVEFRCE